LVNETPEARICAALGVNAQKRPAVINERL
jgi:hypothetical protein